MKVLRQIMLPEFIPKCHLHANSISHIPPSRLTGSYNLNHLPPLHSIISGHWIIRLDARKLRFAETVALEKLLFLILRKD